MFHDQRQASFLRGLFLSRSVRRLQMNSQAAIDGPALDLRKLQNILPMHICEPVCVFINVPCLTRLLVSEHLIWWARLLLIHSPFLIPAFEFNVDAFQVRSLWTRKSSLQRTGYLWMPDIDVIARHHESFQWVVNSNILFSRSRWIVCRWTTDPMNLEVSRSIAIVFITDTLH